MRSRLLRASLLAPLLLAVMLPAARADEWHGARGVPDLRISPHHVYLGRVPVNPPGCTFDTGLPVGCVQRIVTLTNTGTEAIVLDSFSTCTTVFPDGSCSESGPSWGGVFSDRSDGACTADSFDFVLDPGESCYLRLFAYPTARKWFKAFEVVRVHDSVDPLLLRFESIKITLRGVCGP
ncbi:MAG TPA: hypothetical protein VLK34_04550 [Nocardioidaceae bacterium]|nr:hypothetical protein [Nocardioidaceae bacterium]